MTQAARKLTFEEYARLETENWVQLGLPEGRCEYWDGEIVELPTESEFNDFIANFLMVLLVNRGVISLRLVRPGKCEIEVLGEPKTRFPDLVILQDKHIPLTQRRLFISLNMPPPQLVAEVVSIGDSNHKRDYEAKRKQYQEREIPGYWLIDPEQGTLTVLHLMNSQYVEFGVFQENQRVSSPSLGELDLTCNQLFSINEVK